MATELLKVLYEEHGHIARVLGMIHNSQSEPGKDSVNLLVEFFREYADRIHHGKEEDILFRKLGSKDMSKEHKNLVSELVEEHKKARALISEFSLSKEPRKQAKKIVELYSMHIQKENKRFPELESYLILQEKKDMKKEFESFDMKEKNKDYTEMIDKIIESLR